VASLRWIWFCTTTLCIAYPTLNNVSVFFSYVLCVSLFNFIILALAEFMAHGRLVRFAGSNPTPEPNVVNWNGIRCKLINIDCSCHN
jgi:hypothetical protein